MSFVDVLAKFRVRTKILSIVALIGLLVLGGVFFTNGRMRQIDDEYSKFLDRESVSWISSSRIAKNIIEARYYMMRMTDGTVAMENRNAIAPLIKSGLEEASGIAKAIKNTSPAFAERAISLETQIETLRQTAAQVVSLSLATKDKEAKDIVVNARPVFDKMMSEVDQLRIDTLTSRFGWDRLP